MKKRSVNERIATVIAGTFSTIAVTFLLWPISKILSVAFFVSLMLANVYLF